MRGTKILTDRQLKFSVIIPAYNASKTLQRCLDSILSSNYLALEVVVVDDGSSDATAQIVREYASGDSRIQLMIQKNAGPAAARNKGMEHAAGDIIAFVDSDDMIEPNYFEELNQVFQKTNADVVFFEFARVTENDSVISRHKLPELRADYYRNLMSLSEADTFGYTWVKAFRRSVISDVRFKENMMLFEDELFTLDALKKPLKMYYLKKELYHYVCAGSTSLARRTHENYQELCDVAYCAWKELLNNRREGADFLKKKAANCNKKLDTPW